MAIVILEIDVSCLIERIQCKKCLLLSLVITLEFMSMYFWMTMGLAQVEVV